MMVPRGKVTGGSSAVNGQVLLRGVPEDYDSWAALGIRMLSILGLELSAGGLLLTSLNLNVQSALDYHYMDEAGGPPAVEGIRAFVRQPRSAREL